MTTYRKKLIEAALPLEAINAASAREKSIRHGHPSALHLSWVAKPPAQSSNVFSLQQIQFDNGSHPCYKLNTSPLFLRGQGARRLITASAFLTHHNDAGSKTQGER
jgi:hypothetical protein